MTPIPRFLPTNSAEEPFLEEGIAALKRLNYREPLCAYNGWDTSYAVISVADKEERNDGEDEGSRD